MAVAAGLGFSRFATRAHAQTPHIRLYVEMDVPPAREREMLDTFHNVFRPRGGEAPGLHPREDAQAPHHHPGNGARRAQLPFELEFESEELRQKWIASAGHERVWPPVERTMKTLKDYPVVLYDEV